MCFSKIIIFMSLKKKWKDNRIKIKNNYFRNVFYYVLVFLVSAEGSLAKVFSSLSCFCFSRREIISQNNSLNVFFFLDISPLLVCLIVQSGLFVFSLYVRSSVLGTCLMRMAYLKVNLNYGLIG